MSLTKVGLEVVQLVKVKKRRISALEQYVEPHISAALDGTVLAVDPSSGSANSLPGYALFRAGVFVDGGLITLPVGSTLTSRLYALATTLRTEFECPTLLVTEKIAAIGMGTGFSANAMLSLQKSVGVVISSFNCPVIEVAPITWRTHIPEDYVKRDDNDALMMAYTVIRTAQLLANGKPTICIDSIRPYFNK